MSFQPFSRWRPIGQWVKDIFGKAMPETVFFRVDGGKTPGLSMGHVQRCLYLAQAIKEKGGGAEFLMGCDEEAMAVVSSHGFKVKQIDVPKNDPADLNCLNTIENMGHLVVDLPYTNLDMGMLERIHHNIADVVFIDDARFVFPKVGAVLNSSIRVLSECRPKSYSPSVRLFLGPKFFIMPEFNADKRERQSGKLKIMISFGGSDPTGLTLKTASVLQDVQVDDVEFTVVLGPCFGDSDHITSIVRRDRRIQVLKNPRSLIHVMQNHDLVICAGGRTMYEALALGIPFFPVGSTANEAEEIRAFSHQGYVSHFLEDWNMNLFQDQLGRLIESIS